MTKQRTAQGLFHRTLGLLSRGLFVDFNRSESDSIIVAGTARSGTTWLAQMLQRSLKSRLVFEPLHPAKVAQYRDFNYFQYMRPGDSDDRLKEYVASVLQGRVRNPWIDRYSSPILPRGRVVKVIRGTLLLKWIHDEFPSVPIVLLIRNPCGVTASRVQLRWATDSDLKPMLSQPSLVEDHLADKLDMIKDLKHDVEKHAAIWSIHNLVPLSQFAPDWAHVVFYEHLCMDPYKTLMQILAAIDRRPLTESLPFDTPSAKATRTSAVVSGQDSISAWQGRISPDDATRIQAVVSQFGMQNLYEKGLTPQPSALDHYRNKSLLAR